VHWGDLLALPGMGIPGFRETSGEAALRFSG
jgi:hypothetical protein